MNHGNMGPIASSSIVPGLGLHAGFSVDDGGMDEYDVADERAHLFEYINPDNMTYEELLALQERIGFVSKGLSRDQINKFPRMKKKDVLKYLDAKQNLNVNQDEEAYKALSKFIIKNPVEETKKSKKKRM